MHNEEVEETNKIQWNNGIRKVSQTEIANRQRISNFNSNEVVVKEKIKLAVSRQWKNLSIHPKEIVQLTHRPIDERVNEWAREKRNSTSAANCVFGWRFKIARLLALACDSPKSPKVWIHTPCVPGIIIYFETNELVCGRYCLWNYMNGKLSRAFNTASQCSGTLCVMCQCVDRVYAIISHISQTFSVNCD